MGVRYYFFMEKDFEGWNDKKVNIDGSPNPVFFYEREIWWTCIGHNVGHEEDGKGEEYSRPVLVFRKFNRNFFYGIPLSTTGKRGQYYFPFVNSESIESVALLSHMRDYSIKRLLNKHATISKEDYAALQGEMLKIITRKAL